MARKEHRTEDLEDRVVAVDRVVICQAQDLPVKEMAAVGVVLDLHQPEVVAVPVEKGSILQYRLAATGE